MKIIVTQDEIAPRQWRFVAMTEHDHENYEPEYPAGTGASPLLACEDLLWHLDLDDDTQYEMEIR